MTMNPNQPNSQNQAGKPHQGSGTPLYSSAPGDVQPLTQATTGVGVHHAATSHQVNTSNHRKPGGKFRIPQFLSGISSLLQLVLGALLLAFVINQFVFQSYQVFGGSMTPTLSEGDRLIVSKLGKSWSGALGNDHVPKRGDIIVFNSPLNPNVQLVKRVIGLPGERVTVVDGRITVFNDDNPEGIFPDDTYDIKEFAGDSNIDVRIGETEIFVSGDNRSPGGSLDSRNDLGLVPVENVIGELLIRVFPLNQAEVY